MKQVSKVCKSCQKALPLKCVVDTLIFSIIDHKQWSCSSTKLKSWKIFSTALDLLGNPLDSNRFMFGLVASCDRDVGLDWEVIRTLPIASTAAIRLSISLHCKAENNSIVLKIMERNGCKDMLGIVAISATTRSDSSTMSLLLPRSTSTISEREDRARCCWGFVGLVLDRRGDDCLMTDVPVLILVRGLLSRRKSKSKVTTPLNSKLFSVEPIICLSVIIFATKFVTFEISVAVKISKGILPMLRSNERISSWNFFFLQSNYQVSFKYPKPCSNKTVC